MIGAMGSPAAESSAAIRGRPARVAAIALLFTLAALHFGWNAAAQPGFWGYDEAAHAAVAFGIAETGTLPHPLSGWSTFHPPVNALLGAGALTLLDGSSGRAALFGLRLPSLLGALLLGVALFGLVLPRFGFAAAWLASALALFLPVTQLAASMVGNEALAAGLAALALPPLLAWQREPEDRSQALLFGLLAGLACATKFTGAWTLALAACPWSKSGGRAWRSLALCVGVALLVAGPFYLRNVATTGTPVPMTRNLQPMKHFEQRLQLRPRQLSDYLPLPWRCASYPYVTVVAPGGGAILGVNPAMQSVPCLLYAGLWFDPFGIRGGRTGPSAGVGWGLLLLGLGLVPTLLVLHGLGLALRAVVRSRGHAEETPLVLLLALGLGSFASFSWIAPSLAAAKASYLLPLVAPAGCLFAAGLARFAPSVQRVLYSVCGVAVAVAAFVFTTGVVFPPTAPEASREYWTRIGQVMPDSHIVPAVARLIDAPPD
jgi:4-amino-4-deoxy-L-arabinose transferase-like glycosyltransferase